jgi:ABC-type lipoprotein export system ATPase subunit
MVTHDPMTEAHADDVLFLADGHIVHELPIRWLRKVSRGSMGCEVLVECAADAGW